jgi:hypothetical protein
MIKLNRLIKEHLIYEGLIHSVSQSTFKDMVERWSGANDKIKIVYRPNNVINIHFIYYDMDKKEFNILLKLINNLGWFVSAYLEMEQTMKWKKFNQNEFSLPIKNLSSLQVEAKFDLELTDIEFDILYHTSPSINNEKIKKIGLVPKNQSKISYHPERIYFTRTKEELDTIAYQFHKLNPTIIEFSVFEINIAGAKDNNRSLRLFNDPNFYGGIYTLSNIPPKFITLINKITI